MQRKKVFYVGIAIIKIFEFEKIREYFISTLLGSMSYTIDPDEID